MTTYAVVNPATGETLKTYETITDEGLKEAIGRAYDAHEGWGRATTVEQRAQIIARVGTLHDERADELADIITREMQADRAVQGRGRVRRGDLPVLRRQRRLRRPRGCGEVGSVTCRGGRATFGGTPGGLSGDGGTSGASAV
jgi:hypothetical protein